MAPMVAVFAVMSATFVTAQVGGTAANAIFLQYTAPTWMFLASVLLLGERVQRRNLGPVLVGLVGVGVIVVGGWGGEELPMIGLGLTSGVCYAAVVIFLRGAVRRLAVLAGRPQSGRQRLGAVAVGGYGAVAQRLPVGGAGRLRRPSDGRAVLADRLRPAQGQPAGSGHDLAVGAVAQPGLGYLIVGEVPAVPTLIGGAFILGAISVALLASPLPPNPLPGAERGRKTGKKHLPTKGSGGGPGGRWPRTGRRPACPGR